MFQLLHEATGQEKMEETAGVSNRWRQVQT